MTIWRIRIACWIRKATNTHAGCVILIAFPLQQYLHESASMLRYTYIVCYGLFSDDVIRWDNMTSNLRAVSELERLWNTWSWLVLCVYIFYKMRGESWEFSVVRICLRTEIWTQNFPKVKRSQLCVVAVAIGMMKRRKKNKYSRVTPFRLVNTCSLQTVRSSIGSVIHQYVVK